MLKIWLTWLQPSLGILGIMLVLTSPLSSFASQKASTVNRASKAVQTRAVVAGTAKPSTSVDLTGIAATPDLAVRQLAIDALEPKIAPASAAATKNRQQSTRNAVDTFLTPPTPQAVATKVTKPKAVKRPIDKALARTAPTKSSVPVAGIFIGNSEVRGASKYTPDASRSVQPLASAEIGAPTPLSAMMGAAKTVSPYPVVRPETMQKLTKSNTLATVPARTLAPVATTAGAKKTVPAIKSSIAALPATARTTQSLQPTITKLDKVAPQSLDPIASIPAPFRQEVPNSLDPIASIPSGLQRLLGNNLDDNKPVAPIRVAKTIAPKVSPAKANPILAINSIVAPTTAPTVVPSGSSLQLATAQAYTSVPKFDIPGERLASLALAKPATTVASVAAKRPQKATFVTAVQPQDDYLPIVTARQIESHTQQSWTLVGQRNNLGGLILGSSPQPNTLSNKLGLASTSEVITPDPRRGLTGIQRLPIN
jgi:hypothetical protein